MPHRIRILSYTDIHGTIYPHSYADHTPQNKGLAKLKPLIDFLRDDHTVLIDNGDTLEGTPLTFFHFKKRADSVCPMTLAMREAGVDFVNIGNHDLNFGQQALFRHLSECGATCITKNVVFKGKPLAPPYVMRVLGGKRIAFFGVTTQYIPHWEQEENLENMTFPDAFETVRDTVHMLRNKPPAERPDCIVCAYHGGFDRDPETGERQGIDTGENEGFRMLTEIEGLDVLISGHQHRVCAGERNGTVYTQSGMSGQLLSVVDINTLTGEITPRLIPVEDDIDTRILKPVQEEEDACQAWLDEAIGETALDLTVPDEDDARLHKAQIITFLNQVQMRVTGAELSASALFMGAKGFQKTVTMRDVMSTYPFPNTLVVKRITGKILKEYLEHAAEYWTIGEDGEVCVSEDYLLPVPTHFNYDMVDGVEYTIRVSNPKGARITSLTRNGSPIRDDDTFTMAVNNYRASGGGGYDMIVDAPTVSDRQIDVAGLIAEDIEQHPVISFTPCHNILVEK